MSFRGRRLIRRHRRYPDTVAAPDRERDRRDTGKETHATEDAVAVHDAHDLALVTLLAFMSHRLTQRGRGGHDANLAA